MRPESLLVLGCVLLAACGGRGGAVAAGPSPRTESSAASRPAGDAPAGGAPLGSRDYPVLARGPFGEREYLQRLRCPDGAPPQFHRGGSTGAGADGHILDVYEVRCGTGGTSARRSVYMDMYHPSHRERRPIPGFTVLPELPARTAAGCPPRVVPDADSSARYVFNYLEVETPAEPLNLPRGPVDAGVTGYASVSFVIDTTGVPEPASFSVPDYLDARVRAAAERIVRGLRFRPAEHHAGCRVRQGIGVSLELR